MEPVAATAQKRVDGADGVSGMRLYEGRMGGWSEEKEVRGEGSGQGLGDHLAAPPGQGMACEPVAVRSGQVMSHQSAPTGSGQMIDQSLLPLLIG